MKNTLKNEFHIFVFNDWKVLYTYWSSFYYYTNILNDDVVELIGTIKSFFVNIWTIVLKCDSTLIVAHKL